MDAYLPTQRQRMALQHSADGYRRDQSAFLLGITVKVLDHERVAVREGLGARTWDHAIAIAIRFGYIT